MSGSRAENQSRWDAIIEEQARSDQSVAAFCAERGLKEYSFYWHRRRKSQSEETGGFREVRLCADPTWIRVVMPGGIHIEIGRGFDPQCLRAAVKALS